MRIAVDALLFDLDGTLVDSRRDLATSVQFLQKTCRMRVSSEDEVASYVGDGMQRLVERAVPELPKKLVPDAIRIFIQHYRLHCLDHTRPYPGVSEMLHHFRDKALAVVTNKPWRVSRRILDGLGWGNRFRCVVGGNSLSAKKPSPIPVRYALQALRVIRPSNAVMIGDGVNDILAGRAAGTWTCGILSNIGSPQDLINTRPHFIVLTAHDLMHHFN